MPPLPAHLVVRPVALPDAGALRDLRVEALRLHPVDLTADLAETEATPPREWQEQAARSVGDGGEVIVLAEDSRTGTLGGMAGVYTQKQPKLAHAGVVWGVYVREPYRRQGVAAALVRACVEWARAKRLVTLRLSVTAANDTARRCYERCGFVPYGVEPLAVQWQGRYYDETLMVLRL